MGQILPPRPKIKSLAEHREDMKKIVYLKILATIRKYDGLLIQDVRDHVVGVHQRLLNWQQRL